MATISVWAKWEKEALLTVLPKKITLLKKNLSNLHSGDLEKNKLLLAAFKENPPSEETLGKTSWKKDFMALGYAIMDLGKYLAQDGDTESAIELFQVAHEIFRIYDISPLSSAGMKRALLEGIKIHVISDIELIKKGESDAEKAQQHLHQFAKDSWTTPETQLTSEIDEILIRAIEQMRGDIEDNAAVHRRIIQDNLEAVLKLDVPTRLLHIKDKWKEIAEHVAPEAMRIVEQTVPMPEKPSDLIPAKTWNQVENSLTSGDIRILQKALEDIESLLVKNLLLRFEVEPKFKEPLQKIRYQQGVDHFFQEAYELYIRNDKRCLEKFRDIHLHRTGHTLANEWYAYVLDKFGKATDIYDVVEALEDAIKSSYFQVQGQWTARWDLAIAYQRMSNRQNDALNTLLPILEIEYYPVEVLELAIRWSIEQEQYSTSKKLLPLLPYVEAQLLGIYYDLRDADANENNYDDSFRLINRILNVKDLTIPKPDEKMQDFDLQKLVDTFITNRMSKAGLEWFKHRLSEGYNKNSYKNWDCAAQLALELDDFNRFWVYSRKQIECTTKNPRVSNEIKQKILHRILMWAEQHKEFKPQGLRLLRQESQNVGHSEADRLLWEKRLSSPEQPKPTEKTSQGASVLGISRTTDKKPDLSPAQRPPGNEIDDKDLDQVIQQYAMAFKAVASPEGLARQAEGAKALLNAVCKKKNIPQDLENILNEIIAASVNFTDGVDEEEGQKIADAMKEQLDPLRKFKDKTPVELMGLVEACERVIQKLAVRLKVVPELAITPPAALKLDFEMPDADDSYVTTIIFRIANPAEESARHIMANISSPSEFFQALEANVFIPDIAEGEKRIGTIPVQISHGIEPVIDIRINVTYELSGIRRNINIAGKIELTKRRDLIPASQRYITTAPVSADRVDAFRGREKELKELSYAFADGKLNRLYFVNGIRRVGKSSLMQHLGNKMGDKVLSLLLNVETVLGGQKLNTAQFVKELIREALRQVYEQKDLKKLVKIPLPTQKDFKEDPPWVIFDNFLEELRKQTKKANILLCFDEVQRVVARIAEVDNPIDDGFLAWLRGKAQTLSKILIVCTGSEPYDIMQERYSHTLWANMEAYSISFVNKNALKEIATMPVDPDEVTWLPEAIDRLWDMTEGHPWITQIFAENVCLRLNTEKRRVVAPQDVELAADDIADRQVRVGELWWNEKENLVKPIHRDIALMIIQNQPTKRAGLPEAQLIDLCRRAGISNITKQLMAMKALEVVTNYVASGEQQWRIRSDFLEKHIIRLIERQEKEKGEGSLVAKDQPLALMVDWENVKISLQKYVAALEDTTPEMRAKMLSKLKAENLAATLWKRAKELGKPEQRWAVANWDKFPGDQRSLKRQVRYETDMAGDSKADASDHVLRAKIDFVQEQHPEIITYIIATGDADFSVKMQQLQDKEKQIFLWSTHDSISDSYKYLLTGPNPIQVMWLEDFIFEESQEDVNNSKE